MLAKMSVDAALATSDKELCAEREARARQRESELCMRAEESRLAKELGEAREEIGALRGELERCLAEGRKAQDQVGCLLEENSLLQVEADALRSCALGELCLCVRACAG